MNETGNAVEIHEKGFHAAFKFSYPSGSLIIDIESSFMFLSYTFLRPHTKVNTKRISNIQKLIKWNFYRAMSSIYLYSHIIILVFIHSCLHYKNLFYVPSFGSTQFIYLPWQGIS